MNDSSEPVELVDVLAPDGSPTGTTKAKDAVHRSGDWHRCAHLWIVGRDARVLMQRRSEAKENWPGRWDVSVAGHLSAGEAAAEGAVREAREELGMDLAPSDLTYLGTTREEARLHGGRYIDNEIHEIFVVRMDVDPAALTLDGREVAEVRFVRWEEIARLDPVPHPEEYALLESFLSGGAISRGGLV